MPRQKSPFALSVDAIQKALRPRLQERGFRMRGRTFNRLTDDGLVQVVNIMMGPSEPPAWTEIPGLRESFHGLFTVNLGVFVPEVARVLQGIETKSWIQDYNCCVRPDLERKGLRQYWWPASAKAEVIEDVWASLEEDGLPLLERFADRDKLLNELVGRDRGPGASDPPRIVCAIIKLERGDRVTAKELLQEQVRKTDHAGHIEYVERLAHELGLGEL